MQNVTSKRVKSRFHSLSKSAEERAPGSVAVDELRVNNLVVGLLNLNGAYNGENSVVWRLQVRRGRDQETTKQLPLWP
jgi:hypothetical protein